LCGISSVFFRVDFAIIIKTLFMESIKVWYSRWLKASVWTCQKLVSCNDERLQHMTSLFNIFNILAAFFHTHTRLPHRPSTYSRTQSHRTTQHCLLFGHFRNSSLALCPSTWPSHLRKPTLDMCHGDHTWTISHGPCLLVFHVRWDMFDWKYFEVGYIVSTAIFDYLSSGCTVLRWFFHFQLRCTCYDLCSRWEIL
jgi:hypothetical protein